MSDVMESASEEPSPYIVEDEEVMNGSARISGTRVRVLDVFMRYKSGESPDEVAEAFDLGLDQVHAALSYYFGNKEKIEAELKDREEIIIESENRHDSKL